MNIVQINALLGAIVLTIAGFALLNSQSSAENTDFPWLTVGGLIAVSLLAGAMFKRKSTPGTGETANNKKRKR